MLCYMKKPRSKQTNKKRSIWLDQLTCVKLSQYTSQQSFQAHTATHNCDDMLTLHRVWLQQDRAIKVTMQAHACWLKHHMNDCRQNSHTRQYSGVPLFAVQRRPRSQCSTHSTAKPLCVGKRWMKNEDKERWQHLLAHKHIQSEHTCTVAIKTHTEVQSSEGDTVAATAASTSYATPMTCCQWPVAPQARNEQWENGEGCPPSTAVLIISITRTNVPVYRWVRWSVLHTVIDKAVNTAEACNMVNTVTHTIWCISATASRIGIRYKIWLAVDTLLPRVQQRVLMLLRFIRARWVLFVRFTLAALLWLWSRRRYSRQWHEQWVMVVLETAQWTVPALLHALTQRL